MPRGFPPNTAIVGVTEHASAAECVTITTGGELLDRRRLPLIDEGLPEYPYHHERAWAMGRYLKTPGVRRLTMAEVVALVRRVEASSARKASEGLAALAASLPVPIVAIAIRACPDLPPAIEARIADNRAQTMADSVMYRQALATAAAGRGWQVHWYNRETVAADAAAALDGRSVEWVLQRLGQAAGPPWQARQKLAATAALAAAATWERGARENP